MIRKRPHNVYIEDVLWDAAMLEAERTRSSIAVIINMALRSYLPKSDGIEPPASNGHPKVENLAGMKQKGRDDLLRKVNRGTARR